MPSRSARTPPPNRGLQRLASILPDRHFRGPFVLLVLVVFLIEGAIMWGLEYLAPPWLSPRGRGLLDASLMAFGTALVVVPLFLRPLHRRFRDLVGRVRAGVSALAAAAGRDYARALAIYLGRHFDAGLAFVGVLDADGRLRIEGLWISEGVPPGVFGEIGIEGTPCERVLERGRPMCVPQGVLDHFPEASQLRACGAVGYLGAPIFRADGSKLGLVAVVTRHPVAEPEASLALVETFAARAAAEIERAEAGEDLQCAAWMASLRAELAALAGDFMQPLESRLEAIVGHLVEQGPKLTGAPTEGAIFVTDGDELVLTAASAGFPADVPCRRQLLKIGECLCGQAAARGTGGKPPIEILAPGHEGCRGELTFEHGHYVVPLLLAANRRGCCISS